MYKVLFTVVLFVLIPVLVFSQTARDFTLDNIDSVQISLSDYIGEKIIILDFWASWCVPCTRLLPELQKIKNEFDIVEVIAVSIDNPRSVNRARSMIRSQGYDIVTVYDSNHDVKELYRVTDIPRTFIIDLDGKIVYDHTGFSRGDEKEIHSIISKLVADSEVEDEEKN